VSAYQRSKLCNILLTRELARRWAGTGVTVTCLHPGFVATGFGTRSGGGLLSVILWGAQAFGISPEKGAQTIVYLAASPEYPTSPAAIFIDAALCGPPPRPRTTRPAERLWLESAKLAEVG
jgi:retinol dehydrogenase 12